MGFVTPGIPNEVVVALLKEDPIEVFVELATYKGDSRLGCRTF